MAEETKSGWKKAVLRWAGLMLLVLCVVYLFQTLTKLDLERLFSALGWREWSLTCALAITYGASLALLAKAWSAMAARQDLPLMTMLAVYGPGTVAKYVPGSILQYASRHLIGKRAAMKHGDMARASIVEAALHVAIALGLAGLLLLGAGFWAVGCVAAIGILASRFSRPLMKSLGWQLIFFSVYASIVMLLGNFVAFADDPERLAGYFLLAWAAGFLVPIAPGGIGIREAVLLATAAPLGDANSVALLALLARLVGILGDALFGMVGYFALARLNRHAPG